MKRIIFLTLIISLPLFVFVGVNAQEIQSSILTQVDYQGQVPVDMDLDGITDQGEIQIYNTDPVNPDSDSDGYYDGIEIIAETEPLNKNSIPGVPSAVQGTQYEIPWAWYFSRASGLVAFILLYISIFLSLTLRVSFLRNLFAPLYAMQAHCWISLQATILALIHAVVLIFDKFFGLNLVDIFIPFASNYEKNLVALGILSFYLMLILVATSYGKKYISQKTWRMVHFLNIILYVVVVLHAYYLGTDMQNDIVKNIFVYSNVFLVLLMLVNMFLRIKEKITRKNAIASDSELIK